MIWIARDNTDLDNLYLYLEKPHLKDDAWLDSSDKGYFMNIPSELYPEITFKNSPQILRPKSSTSEKIKNIISTCLRLLKYQFG